MAQEVVNTVTFYEAENDGATITITLKTALPATPQLNIFCCNTINVPTYSKRRPDQLIHGFAKRFPCEPHTFLPEPLTGDSFVWTIDATECQCENGNLVIFEPAEKPKLSWTSSVRPCPKPPEDAIYVFYGRSAQSGPNGNVVSPADRAAFDADLDAFIPQMEACGEVIASDYGTHFFQGIPGVQNPPDLHVECRVLGDVTDRYVEPYVIIPEPARQTWSWWCILRIDPD